MKKVTLGFGRMNPSTTGHELVAKKIAQEAKKRGAVARLYLSHTTNPKKDPLSYDDKIKFAKLAFGQSVDVVKSRARTIIEVMVELEKQGVTDVTVVVGSDRVSEFESLLNRYNGKDFKINSIEVISAGERDPDAEGVSGMSASKMRGFVRDNDFENFKKGVPSALNDRQAKQMFDAVRKGMRLAESMFEACWAGYKQQGLKKKGDRMVPNCVPEENEEATNEVLSMAQRRKRGMVVRRVKAKLKRTRALARRRFASQDKLKTRARRAAVKFMKKRLGGGKAYKDMSVGQKMAIDKRLEKMKGAVSKISARLLPKVRKAEIERKKRQAQSKNEAFESFFEGKLPQDKDISDKPGTQPAKYYAGLDKGTKERRDAHFKRMGPKSDSDQSAYADAPGDKEAREKGMPQSKHTKKFKQMFGEEISKRELSRLDQLVRMGLADKKLLPILKRSVSKLESGDMLNPNERKAAFDLLQTLLDMTLSQDQLFRMTRAQLQKEDLDEAIYKGNIGAMEVFEFYQKANPTQITELKKLISQKKFKEAWALVTKVTGKKLDEMFEDEFAFDEINESDYDKLDGLKMAQIQLANMVDDAEDLLEILDSMDEEPEAWVLAKITKASDYIEGVADYLEYESMYDYEDDEEDDEDEEFELDDEDIYDAISMMTTEELGEELAEEFKDIREEIEGLKKKSEKSGISYGILKKVYDRGMAAWQGGHRPGTTPQQWAFARVNSFITKGSGTWGGADSDLASKVKGGSKSKNEQFDDFVEALEYGTDKARMSYARATPGQSIEITNARYSANTALQAINNANLQRMFKLFSEETIHEAIDWHMDNNVPLQENVYRVGSEKYFELYREARKLYSEGKLELTEQDRYLIEETDIGEIVEFDSQYVPLDCPMIEEEDEKDPPLNQPKRGGPKKFYVFVRKPDGGIKKVTWGDTTGLSVKLDDPEARKSFAARHQCSTQKDRTSAAYWACNTPRYAKQLGLSGGGNFFW